MKMEGNVLTLAKGTIDSTKAFLLNNKANLLAVPFSLLHQTTTIDYVESIQELGV